MNEINEEKITQDIKKIKDNINNLINIKNDLNDQRALYTIFYTLFIIILIMSIDFNNIVHLMLLVSFYSIINNTVGLIYSKMIQKKLKVLMAKSIELEYVENCRNEIKEYEYSKIFDKDNLSIKEKQIKELKEKYNRLKELYYSTGYNIIDLNKYKNNGTLSKKLNKNYTENEIKIIENILEEKAKVLTKKLDKSLKTNRILFIHWNHIRILV